MALLSTFLTVSSSLLITPFLVFLLSIIFLASIGKSLGVRRLYVKLLLQLFEYGRQHIEIAQQKDLLRSTTVEEEKADRGDAESSTKNIQIPKVINGERQTNGITHVISREDLILVPDAEQNYTNGENLPHGEEENNIEVSQSYGLPRRPSFETFKREYQLADCFDYIKAGVEAIIEDQVTHRFEAEELKSWNLLTRTNRQYEFISWRLTVIWVVGFFMRYFFLLPLRITICFIGVAWMVISTFILSFVPNGRVKRFLYKRSYLTTFRILARSLSLVMTVHDKHYRPENNGVCVANHTTPYDIVVLSAENVFALIGQRHGGFLGILQRALARASPQIWFERSEVKDREAVTRRLRQHVSDPNNPPILIFPEGTCINNTSVMQFKKGSFEVGGVIYPVAIKYDPKFGDAFWNSSKYSMMQYLSMMMSSWAIVCDVWYLPPMYQQEGESAIDFANRVKSVIARQGGLVDLMWDGQLKRMKPKKEWKEKQQEEFSKRLKVE